MYVAGFKFHLLNNAFTSHWGFQVTSTIRHNNTTTSRNIPEFEKSTILASEAARGEQRQVRRVCQRGNNKEENEVENLS